MIKWGSRPGCETCAVPSAAVEPASASMACEAVALSVELISLLMLTASSLVGRRSPTVGRSSAAFRLWPAVRRGQCMQGGLQINKCIPPLESLALSSTALSWGGCCPCGSPIVLGASTGRDL